MKLRNATVVLCLAATQAASTVSAQAPRQDAIWARRTNANITLNGVLNEPAWALAESVTVQMATDAGIPGSGWKYEGGVLPVDPTRAVLKFLVVGNTLYLGARVSDQSIGGSADFNRFDGFLMALKNRAVPGAPKLPAEYLYSWWYPDSADTTPMQVGRLPSFRGTWGTVFGVPRTPAQIAAWDAVTLVNGTTNTDAVNDVGYTVEMKFDLGVMGYDATKPEGDIVEWNISIYDCDWLWPLDVPRLSYNRVWWQSPWGNAYWYDEVHIYVRPDVTVNSGPAPTIRPEIYLPNGAAFAAPTVDGSLTEPVWANAYSFDIRWGDGPLRAGYPGVGPWRSGQFQPTLFGHQADRVDSANCTVKMFHRGNDLYLGFDVRDAYVQFHPAIDRWDGFIITINDRAVRGPDNELRGRRLSLQVGPTGAALPQDYLSTLVGMGGANAALHMNTGTTVDTLGVPDNGYTGEVRLDLTKLGYPAGLGDRALFIGINHLDGDSFDPFTDSYSNRVWWFREFEGQCCPAWVHLAENPPTDTGPIDEAAIDASTLLGAFPVPGLRPSIRYSLAQRSRVVLNVYDVAGRVVERRALGVQAAGVRAADFDGRGRRAGVYLYRLDLEDPATGVVRKSLGGRMVVLGR
jgi:hypothetical protein